ncbi:MAG: transcription antitermination factor NusB [Myxococcota bacterium]
MTVVNPKAREAALWLLYGVDVSNNWGDVDLDQWYATVHDVDEDAIDYWHEVDEMTRGVMDRRPELDERIQAVSPRWRLERMATIDRNILRLGAWELFYSETPPLVVINECIELGKKYGEEKTSAFVNGLLDQLCSDHDIEIS